MEIPIVFVRQNAILLYQPGKMHVNGYKIQGLKRGVEEKEITNIGGTATYYSKLPGNIITLTGGGCDTISHMYSSWLPSPSSTLRGDSGGVNCCPPCLP